MQTCGHWWEKTVIKLLFIQKCPQISQKLSASNACMLATFSMSACSRKLWASEEVDSPQHLIGLTLFCVLLFSTLWRPSQTSSVSSTTLSFSLIMISLSLSSLSLTTLTVFTATWQCPKHPEFIWKGLEHLGHRRGCKTMRTVSSQISRNFVSFGWNLTP